MRPGTESVKISNVSLPGDIKEPVAISVAMERMRDDLELIGYVASHDLLAPLRIILSTCEELHRHPGLSDDPGRQALTTIDQEAARLKILLQGVLDYVRLETFTTTHTPLDSQEIVSAAMMALDNEIKTSNASITYNHLPRVLGHRGRLTRLFAHILDNAIKFRHPNRSPVISISAQPKNDKWEFCVADNGIGIEEEHHDIIFALFQRLHTKESYDGHGIGLALSRKIVQAHEGEIWVESTPGEGSRFYFTLPAANNG